MLKKVIPASIWQQHTCIIVHPGIKGDRGPSSLDWAILHAHEQWGVTLLQADAEMDAGAIWASRPFAIRGASKSHLYRHEATEAAIEALLETIAKCESNTFVPESLDYSREDVRGCLQASMKQADRAIDWAEPSASILRKIRCADSFPGIVDTVLGMPCYLYGAHEEDVLRGRPGEIIAKRDGAICRATGDGAIWITHLKQKGPDGQPSFKLPATQVLGNRLAHVPDGPLAVDQAYDGRTYRDIWYEERQAVGYLHFDFYNGAMSTDHCQRLREAFLLIRQRPTKVIVLMGGPDFWSNGIHLNVIEAANDPAQESWRNIQAMNDLVRELITTESHLVISALQAYREEELQWMWMNFFGADRSYHLARKRFVYKGLIPSRERGDERCGTGGRVEFPAGQAARWHDGEQPARDDYCRRASMTAEILNGRAMSAEMKAELRSEVRRCVENQGQAPGLVIVRVGGEAASGVYSTAILRGAEAVGVTARLAHLPVHTSADELRALLVQLNTDQAVHGILVQMPLPAHLSQKMVATTIASSKDIDGIGPHSAGNLFLGLPSFLPSTAAAVMELLGRTHTPLEGRRVVVISRSNVVGKPLGMMLLQKNATVTICHSCTTNLAAVTRQADVLVAAAGCARMVTAEMVKPGAIVIDVGINALPGGGMVGDVDFASVREVAGAITPVPGGVGPLTNVMLLKQCVQAAWQLAGEKKDFKTAA